MHILPLLGKTLVTAGTVITTKLFTEKVIIKLLVNVGDYLVKKSTNSLTKDTWQTVKSALNS